jgi:hypothetical protein
MCGRKKGKEEDREGGRKEGRRREGRQQEERKGGK